MAKRKTKAQKEAEIKVEATDELLEKEDETLQAEIPEEAPKAKAKQYWKSPTYIPNVGVVKGEVNPGHLDRFKALVPKETVVANWLLDYDPEAKRIAEARKKFKERAGLRE